MHSFPSAAHSGRQRRPHKALRGFLEQNRKPQFRGCYLKSLADLGVAVFERKYGRKRRSDGGQAQQNSPKNESQRTQPKSEKRGGKPIRTSPPKKETAPDETEAEIIKDLAEMEEQTHEPI